MIKPISRYIALKRIVEEVKSESGMLLSAKEASELRYQKGTIIAVGDEITNLKEGDIVLYDKSNSYEMIIDEELVAIIQYREVVAIF